MHPLKYRHGESIWNVTDPVRGLVTRFTGWVDVPLTERGKMQAAAAGRCLKIYGIKPDIVYTSLLKRAQNTFEEIERTNPDSFNDTKIVYSWRLNERHYGSLVGLSKEEAGRKMGNELVMEWRRSWDARPPPLEPDGDITKSLDYTSNFQPQTIIYKNGIRKAIATEKGITLPLTESLHDCANRVYSLWKNGIYPLILKSETVLIVAHANTIRTMIKHIDSEVMTVHQLRDVHIPSAIPLIYDFMRTSDGSVKPIGLPTALGMRGRYLLSQELVELNLNRSENIEHDDEEDNPRIADQFYQQNDIYSKNDFFDLIEFSIKEVIEYSESINGSREPLLITDGSGCIIKANQAWLDVCGFTEDKVIGKLGRFCI